MGLDASAIAAKWARAMQQAGESIKAGVAAVTEAPGAKAADAQERWLAGVQRARDEGTFAANSRAVTLEQWKRAMLDKGVGRISAGVTAAQPVFMDFMAQLLPIAQASSRAVAAMPKGTLEDSKARMIANMENMSRFKFVRRR